VPNRPNSLTNHATASALRPPIGTAARSLRETETTRAPGNFSFSRSPRKSPEIRTGDAGRIGIFGAFGGAPTHCAARSSTQYSRRAFAASYQLLATIPVSRGSRPVPIAVWPGHVSVAAWRWRAPGYGAP